MSQKSQMVARRYSTKDIDGLIEIYRAGGDLPEAEIAGMERLSFALHHYEFMSNEEVDLEMRHYFAANELTKSP